MAGALIQIEANGAATWSNFVTAMSAAFKGSLFVSLSNFTGNSAPEVEDGSYCDINGAIYKLTPNGSTEAIADLAAIANSSTIYFYAVPSGSSVTHTGSITAPTWSETKGGFYNGNNRCFGGCYKDGGGNYVDKWVIDNKSEVGVSCKTSGVSAGNVLSYARNLKIATGGEDAPDCDAGGATIGARDAGTIMTIKAIGSNHGMTDLAEADTFFSVYTAMGDPGIKISTFNAGGGTYRSLMIDAHAQTEDTTTGGTAVGAITMDGNIKSGTNDTGMGATGNIIVFSSNGSAKFIIKGNGDFKYDGGGAAYDDQDDFGLVEAAHDPNKNHNLKSKLEELGIVENGFISGKKMTLLQLGTMNKMIKILKKLGEKLGLTEDALLALANE